MPTVFEKRLWSFCKNLKKGLMTTPNDDAFDLPGFTPKDGAAKRPARPRPPSSDSRPDKPRYGSDRPGSDRPRYGSDRPGSDRPRYGSDRPGSDRPRYGSDRPGSDRPRYGSDKPGSDRPRYGSDRPAGDRPRYGSDRPSRPSYGSRDGAPRDGRGSPPPRSGGYGGSRDGAGSDRGGSRGGDFKPRSDFKPRGYGDKKDFAPRGDSAGRPPYKPRGEFKPRSDYAPRTDYKPRTDGPRDGERSGSGDRDRGSDRPRSGGFDKPRSSFGAGQSREPRSGGGFRDAGEFKPRFSPPQFETEFSPVVSKFLPLKHEKGRYRESRFLIEGAKNIADVLEISPGILHTVLVAQGFDDDKLREALNRHRVNTQEVPAKDLAALSDTEAFQGIMAIANFGALKPDWNTANTVTLLDGVQDPGNVGAILRTSAALGMDAVVLGRGTCDAYNPKVVRASAGSLLRVPMETGEDIAAKIHFLRLKGFSVVATSPHAPGTLAQAKLRRKVALLFGNEGAGVGLNFLDQADAVVRIPMRGKVESLNVAVAHGLMTYELLQLREKK